MLASLSQKLTDLRQQSWPRSHLRVPRADGTWLHSRSFSELAADLKFNQQLVAQAATTIGGLPLSEFRQRARQEVLALACRFTADLLGQDVPLPAEESPLIVTGHQPEWFHCGVWVKHLMASKLAQCWQCTGLNVVIDNDLMTSTSLEVPVGTRGNPARLAVPFDTARPAIAWEEATVKDSVAFEFFSRRLTDFLQHWPLQPVLNDVWPQVIEHSVRNPRLSDCFTSGRAHLERRLTCGNLEVPLRQICETSSFREFAQHLWQNADEVRVLHNATVARCRSIYRIRSHAHPVADLKSVGDWIETPFWIWRQTDSQRRQLFVKCEPTRLCLTDTPTLSEPAHAASRIRLELRDPSLPHRLAEQWHDWTSQGIRIRPRALMTTLFLRLCLSDLFIHGIGGAKYDEITDRLIAVLFGIEPPRFLTLSASYWLPFGSPFLESNDNLREAQHRLRDIEQNPHRHVSPVARDIWQELLTEQESLRSEQQAADAQRVVGGRTPSADQLAGYRRYQRLKELRAQLQTAASPERLRATAEIGQLHLKVAANRLLKSREWSFGLFSFSDLQTLVTAIESYQGRCTCPVSSSITAGH